MLTVALEGVDAVGVMLEDYPAALSEALAAKADALSAMLIAKIRDEKLAGDPLQSRSGALADSIGAEVAANVDGIVASVGSTGVKYAAIQEYGGTTTAHEILPVKAQALAFVLGGTLLFARRVEHPGSTLSARSYMRSSLDEMSDEIVAAFAEAADETWSKR